MNKKIHYLITFGALIFLGMLITNPRTSSTSPTEERTCKMIKGRMDCFYKYTDYRINTNSEVQYKLN